MSRGEAGGLGVGKLVASLARALQALSQEPEEQGALDVRLRRLDLLPRLLLQIFQELPNAEHPSNHMQRFANARIVE